MNNMETPQEIERMETEYLNQFPGAESPLNWFMQVELETILETMSNRKGRKIKITEDPEQLDMNGVLSYV